MFFVAQIVLFFLTQTISCNKNILVDQYVFLKKGFPERLYQELSNCRPFPLYH